MLQCRSAGGVCARPSGRRTGSSRGSCQTSSYSSGQRPADASTQHRCRARRCHGSGRRSTAAAQPASRVSRVPHTDGVGQDGADADALPRLRAGALPAQEVEGARDRPHRRALRCTHWMANNIKLEQSQSCDHTAADAVSDPVHRPRVRLRSCASAT